MAAGVLIYVLWGRKNARPLRELKASLPTSQQINQGVDSYTVIDKNTIHQISNDEHSELHKDSVTDDTYVVADNTDYSVDPTNNSPSRPPAYI
jgi:hypothetical protein